MFRKLTNLLTVLVFSMSSWSVFGADNSVIIGAWAMSLDAGGQYIDLDLNLSEGSDGLEGTMGAAEFGMSALSKIEFDGESLKFETPDQQGGVVVIQLKLDDEGKLNGMLGSPMGDIPATASKK